MKKKGMEMGTFGILAGAIVVLIVAALVIWIVKGGLLAGEKNVVYLSSCKNQGGHCEIKCDPNTENGFYKNGCPDMTGDKTADSAKEYCCINKDNA